MARIFNSRTECSNEVQRLKLLQKQNPLCREIIPPELANSSQWIVWSYEVRERKNGKFGPDKTPYNTRNSRFQPSRWSTSDCSDLATALQCVKDNPHIDGIGYLFSKDDGLIGVDFDNCRDPKTGNIRKEYQFWIDKLDGYAEVSPSGTGIKIWVKGTVDSRCFRTDELTGFRIQNFANGIIEIYRRGQYFTVTTQCLQGFEVIKSAQAELDVLSEFYLSHACSNPLSGWVSGSFSQIIVIADPSSNASRGWIPEEYYEVNENLELSLLEKFSDEVSFGYFDETISTNLQPQSTLKEPLILDEHISPCECMGCGNCSSPRAQCNRPRKIPNFGLCSTCIQDPPIELYKFCSKCYAVSPDHENKVEDAVFHYLSELVVKGFSPYKQRRERMKCKIQFGSRNGYPDVVLTDGNGSFAAIGECKGGGYVGDGIEQLKSYLSATDTRFGIFANQVDRKQWIFYENRRGHDFPEIGRDEFESGVVGQFEKCPRLVDEIQSLESLEATLKTKIAGLKQNESELNVSIENRRTRLGKLETGIHTLIQTERDKQTTYREIEVKIDQLDTQKSRLETEVARLDGEIQSLVSLETGQRKKVDSLKGDERRLNVVIESRRTQLGELETGIQTLTQTKRDRQKTCKGLQVEIGQLDSRKSGLETQVKRLEGEIRSLKSREVDLHGKVEKLKGNEHELNVSIQNQDAKRNGLKTAIETLTQTERDMQACNKKLEVEANQLGNRKSELEIEVGQLESLKSKLHRWQSIIIPSGIVGFVLFFFLGALFLTQRNAAEDAIHQNAVLANQLTQKDSEIRRKDREIQNLTTSLQTVKSENETLSQKVSELENRERNRVFPTNTTSTGMVSLRRQLNKQKDENQKLQDQLVKKDAEIRQLQNDKAVALSESRKLQGQLVENRQGGANQSATVRQLQGENRELQNQNRELRNENKMLQNQLDSAKQSDSDQVDKSPSRPDDGQQPTVSPQTENLVAEPPEKIKVINRAGSHNNQGCLDFEGNNYDEALKQFEQAIKADSKFAVAHYNLGCAYLEMKEYSGAVDAFDKTIALDKKFKEAYYNRSLAYFRTSQFQEARQDATKVLDIHPNYQLAKGLLTAIENAQQ